MASPGPENLEHRHLRAALELAVGVAAAGRRQRPPVPYPAALEPFLNQGRIPATMLGRIRRAIDADPEFRRRVAGRASDGADALDDEIGLEWLRRTSGWEDRVAALIDAAAVEAAAGDLALALKRAEKRRQAAEQSAARVRQENERLSGRLAAAEAELTAIEEGAAEVSTTVAELTAAEATARRDARHAGDRLQSAEQRVAALEVELAAARAEAATIASQRDELLAARAASAGVAVTPTQLAELRQIATNARAVATDLAALVAAPTEQRHAVAIPGEAAGDEHKAADYLLRVPDVLVLIDAYNVAKLVWPHATLEEQRTWLLDATDATARRFGGELVVVFDGADVPGAHARRRRLARVQYSPAGVLADDVIRDEVAATDPARPVVVVTNDMAVRRDVAAAGANIVSSDAFAAIALR